MNIIQEVASFVKRIRYEDLPPAVVHETKRLILDHLYHRGFQVTHCVDDKICFYPAPDHVQFALLLLDFCIYLLI